MHVRVLSFAIVTLVASAIPTESTAETPLAPEAIEGRLLDDIKYLSADERQGRGVGLNGLNEAADFIRDEFKKSGLDVSTVDGGAFQKFTITTGSKLGETNTLQFTDGKTTLDLKLEKDFVVGSFGSPGKFNAPLVFLGYGIDAQKKGYSDFNGVDVKGKIAVILRRVPRQGQTDGPFSGPHGQLSRESSLTSKVSNAYRAGAIAVLFVNDVYTGEQAKQKSIEGLSKTIRKTEAALATLADGEADQKASLQKELASDLEQLKVLKAKAPNDALMKFGYGGNAGSRKIPIGQITIATLNKVLGTFNSKTVQQIESEIDATLKPQSAVLGNWKAVGEFQLARVETEVKNVIGVLEGEGPHADETIVIGAHYDHVGMGGEGSLLPGSTAVHNGADDNASGTVALIELIRQLTKDGKRYPRRLVFMAFTGEERGLLGSAHYVRNPIWPLDNTVAMFNMDMVGRLREKLTIFGSGTATGWDSKLRDAAKKHELSVVLKPEGFGPSDHSSFYAKKIPVLHLFTGTHTDYHKPSDDWQKINIDGMRKIVDLLEDVVVMTATADERPEYIEVKERAQIARSGSRPYFGSIPDFGTEEEGYAIQGVAAGSPADKGGLKGGDRIVLLGKDKIGSLDDFDLALRKHSPNEKVTIEVIRQGKRVKLEVKLGEPR